MPFLRRRSPNASLVLALAPLALAAPLGCGSSSDDSGAGTTQPTLDAAIDFQLDTARPDVQAGDTGPNVAADTATGDAPADTSLDTSAGDSGDAGSADASSDATVDAMADATADATNDATNDVATQDAGSDAPTTGCGNGAIDTGEVCDGTALNGATCQSVLAYPAAGTVGCASDCHSFNVSQCTCTGGRSICTVSGNSTCVDFTADANNCGSCGNVCGATAACASSHCVNVLSAGYQSVEGIAIDANNVYFAVAGDGNVYSVPKTGGSATTLTTTPGPMNTAQMVLDGSTLYWSTAGGQTIESLPISGGTPAAFASNEGVPEGITSDGTNVYWATYNGSEIRKQAIAGGTASTLVSGSPNVVNPKVLTHDATYLYWGNGGTSVGTGSVYRMGKDGSSPTALASNLNPVFGVAVDATNVYFTQTLNNTVAYVPIAGGTVTPLTTSASYPTDIAVDATNVYWINSTTIVRMPKAGGAMTTLASYNGYVSQKAPYSGDPKFLAVDANNVYWSDQGTQYGHGAVFSVSKN